MYLLDHFTLFHFKYSKGGVAHQLEKLVLSNSTSIVNTIEVCTFINVLYFPLFSLFCTFSKELHLLTTLHQTQTSQLQHINVILHDTTQLPKHPQRINTPVKINQVPFLLILELQKFSLQNKRKKNSCQPWNSPTFPRTHIKIKNIQLSPKKYIVFCNIQPFWIGCNTKYQFSTITCDNQRDIYMKKNNWKKK